MQGLLGDTINAAKSYRRMFRDGWRGWRDGRGVRIAVLDTGIDEGSLSNEALKRIVARRSFVPRHLEGDRAHGTACSGVILGMAPGCELVDCGITSADQVSPDALAEAIVWAAESGCANILNISVGTKRFDKVGILHDACRKVISKGAIIVAACPNMGHASLPSAFDDVISVQSLDLGARGRWCVAGSHARRVYCHLGAYSIPCLKNAVKVSGEEGNSFCTATFSAQVARMLSTVTPDGDVFELIKEYGAGVI